MLQRNMKRIFFNAKAVFLLMNYRFAFVIALRQPTISNFHPTGANNNNHAVGFSVVMLSLRVSHSDAIKGRTENLGEILKK